MDAGLRLNNLTQTAIDEVVLVNEQDKEVGVCEKLHAHKNALLHRAFSIFLFKLTPDGLETLLQQRALTKYHSGGLWTNACCSHPRPQENILDAAHRRLQEEMGIATELTYAGAFIYKADVNAGLVEHEYDHVYYGLLTTDVAISPNADEVKSIAWEKIVDLRNDIYQNPDKYTAWFTQALDVAYDHLSVTARS